MKVVSIVRVQLVTLLILSISFGYYAIAVAEQQQELQDAEVNGAQKSSHKIRFGTKIAKIKSLPVEQPAAKAAPTRPTTNQRSAANNRQTASYVPTLNAPRISRRFDYLQEASSSAQLIAQPEIPKSHKKDADANANSSHRVQLQRSRGSTRHRSESIHSATSAQLSEAHSATAQTQVQRRNSTRSRVTNVSNSNVISRTIGSGPNNSLTQSNKSRAPPSGDSARVKKSTTTTTTTQQSLFSRNFQQNNPFNFFSQNFWSLSGPPTTEATPTDTTTTSTKKPPKKYKHAVVTPTPFDDKFNFQKLQSIKTTEKPDIPRRQNNDGPFRIALPTINFLNPPATASTKRDSEREKEKRNTVQSLRERFVCPRESEVRFQLFPKICKTDKDCSIWNRDELCCEIFGSKSCVTGMPKPLEETSHMPILGLIPRKCPTRPLAELWWDVKECATDNDCWPRVCCPDGRRRYCRTSEPELEVVPVPVKRSFNYLTEYLECTPPPPPIFDLHPRACTSTFDCFPNVCCQEAGLRHCRPPKKSLLTLMANFLNVDFVKRLTQNIVIK